MKKPECMRTRAPDTPWCGTRIIVSVQAGGQVKYSEETPRVTMLNISYRRETPNLRSKILRTGTVGPVVATPVPS